MIAPLREIQKLVFATSAGMPVGGTKADHFLLRLQQAVEGAIRRDGTVGTSDIAGLIRQGILRCHLALNQEPELRVPRTEGWPDEGTWRLFGCEAKEMGRDFIISPRQWNPTWLDVGASAVVNAAIQEEPRRLPLPVPADPIVTNCTGYGEYVSPGQRAAVQSAFLAPAGSTIVINLPTGAGKTLAFQVPALARASQGGLTLVVVPTVALAKDQEDRFRAMWLERQKDRHLMEMPFAYHSGLDGQSKKDIQMAIRNGITPIVFASPEAVSGALRGALFDAARQGRLRIFAIDEAHVVSQWGQQFRPEFQSIAGIRNALLAECPPGSQFRTLLLTATLTSESYETLRYLFGTNGCQIVCEAALRPEPAYLIYSAVDEVDRCKRVMDAMRYLPRPIILYTTLRDHALEWFERLREAGFRRLSLVRGGDLARGDGDVLDAWRSQSLDIVVATSAFGLGMDQAHVRSIVHACLPETIDRYYQEVGRSGRDGKAAVALLASTPKDGPTAEGLTEEKIISVDRGFERWEAMWVHRRPMTDGSYVLSLDDRPSDIFDSSEANEAWNLRTLVLMARTGLIGFAAHPPPYIERQENENEEAFDMRRRIARDQFAREIAIHISDDRHSDKAHWNNVVRRLRGELRDADRREIQLVFELQNLQRPLNEIFSKVYELRNPIVRPAYLPGSCPVTRMRGTVSFRSTEPEVTTIERTDVKVSPVVQRAFAPCLDEVGRSWIAYEPVTGDDRESRRLRERIMALLRHTVFGGIVELAISNGVLKDRDWSQLEAHSPLQFLIRAWLDSVAPGVPSVPRLTLLTERDATIANIEHVMRIHRPLHVIVLPRNVVHPIRQYRRLFDVVRHLSINDVLTRFES